MVLTMVAPGLTPSYVRACKLTRCMILVKVSMSSFFFTILEQVVDFLALNHRCPTDSTKGGAAAGFCSNKAAAHQTEIM